MRLFFYFKITFYLDIIVGFDIIVYIWLNQFNLIII